ncbi:MAG: metalloregulator ArsR/SmtB family transcription factor [Campylobacter sp.]|nr:metalloregulator ArsR/SmtB family transcription factor [Campylobacter sp.]
MQETHNFIPTIFINKELVQTLKKQMIDDDESSKLAEFFKVFADNTRVRVLLTLAKTELCVCDIAALLNMSQPSISYQLRVLKQADFVKNRRDGKVIYYSLINDDISYILNQGLKQI